MNNSVSNLRLQDAWRECERNAYPDDGEKNAALINLAIEAAKNMRHMLATIETKLRQNRPEVDLGKPLPAQSSHAA